MIGTQTAILNRLDVGPKKFIAEYVLIMDFTGLQSFLGPEVDFVLGHNLLSEADWVFDTKNQKWDVQ